MVRQSTASRSFDAVRLNSSRLKHHKDLKLNRLPCLSEDPEEEKNSKNQYSSPSGCHKNTSGRRRCVSPSNSKRRSGRSPPPSSLRFSRSKSRNFKSNHGHEKWFPERSLSPEGCSREPEGRDAVEYYTHGLSDLKLLVDAKAQLPQPPPPPSFVRRGRSLSRKKAARVVQLHDDQIQIPVEETVQRSKSFHVKARSRSPVAQLSRIIKERVRSLSPEPQRKDKKDEQRHVKQARSLSPLVNVSHIKDRVRSLSPEPQRKDKKTKRHLTVQIPSFFRGRTKTRNSKAWSNEETPLDKKVLVFSSSYHPRQTPPLTALEYSRKTWETRSPSPTARQMENAKSTSRENAPAAPPVSPVLGHWSPRMSNIVNGNLNKLSGRDAPKEGENDMQQNKRIAGRLGELEFDAAAMLELARIRTRSLQRYFTPNAFGGDYSQSTERVDDSTLSTLSITPQRLLCDQGDIVGSFGETKCAVGSALSMIARTTHCARPQLKLPNTRNHISKQTQLCSSLHCGNTLDTVDGHSKLEETVARNKANERPKLPHPLQRNSCSSSSPKRLTALTKVGEKHHKTLSPVFKQMEGNTPRNEKNYKRRLPLKHVEEKTPKIEKVSKHTERPKVDSKRLVTKERPSEEIKSKGASELRTITTVLDREECFSDNPKLREPSKLEPIAESIGAVGNSHSLPDECSCPSESRREYKGSLVEMAKSFQQKIKLTATEEARSNMESLATISKEDRDSVGTGKHDDRTPVGTGRKEDGDSVETGEKKKDGKHVCLLENEDMDFVDIGETDDILSFDTSEKEDDPTPQIAPQKKGVAAVLENESKSSTECEGDWSSRETASAWADSTTSFSSILQELGCDEFMSSFTFQERGI